MNILFFYILIILVFVNPIIGLWGIFKKANEKPWKAIIPLYNVIVLLGILNKPKWYIVLLIVPVISTIFVYYVLFNTYKQLGKTSFFGQLIGILFAIIFLPIVGFSKKYKWEQAPSLTTKSEIKAWGRAILLSIAVVLFIRVLNIFIYQNYRIPTGAMEKTLLVGDHIYVSKWAIGPRLPITPVALPFFQNKIPVLNINSYVNSIRLPYIRLPKKLTIKRNDIAVFNFPEGDTVAIENSSASYYAIIRSMAMELKRRDSHSGVNLKTDNEYYALGRNQVKTEMNVEARPIDRRDSYIKRCVAIPGDTLKIVAGQIYINGIPQKHIEGMQFNYRIATDGTGINPNVFEKLGINNSDNQRDVRPYENGDYEITLTEKTAQALRENAKVKSVERIVNADPYADIFPHSPKYLWKLDDFGSLWIPKKGVTIKINLDNLCLYNRIINAYEGNKLDVKDSVIYINDKPATTYTFKMDYYFVMGDNRHSSSDSRYWGFVPEDHMIGLPRFIWLSLDPAKDFPNNIRWNRIFTSPSF